MATDDANIAPDIAKVVIDTIKAWAIVLVTFMIVIIKCDPQNRTDNRQRFAEISDSKVEFTCSLTCSLLAPFNACCSHLCGDLVLTFLPPQIAHFFDPTHRSICPCLHGVPDVIS